MNDFETIELADLNDVNGGNRGRAVWEATKKAGAWAWRNVIAPAGGGALYDWATGGNRQPQQPAPQPQQPQQGQ